ncbi:TolC family protein [Dyella sp. OK004]|uniref:TolC family protein n=1 Tax=Dyella sp. OK004 TaxID=1855292 RepID=UPI0015A7116B|nr:TolC family protein [Dyella sp. OK004]
MSPTPSVSRLLLRRHAWLCVAVALALAGCASYEPKPIDTAATHAQWQARRLDDPALAERMRTLLPAGRETWPPPAYGRSELLLAALMLNPDLAEARAHLAEADAAVRTAKALPNPTVSLALERYTQSQAGSSPWLWGITTDMLIDTMLRRRLRADLANAGVRGARLDYAEKVWDVRRSLRTALADVMLAQRQQQLAEQTVAKAGELQAALQQRHALGETLPAEVLQSAQTLAQARNESAAAAQRSADARARLARAVGVPVPALDDVHLRWDTLDTPAAINDKLPALAERAQLSRTDLERALVDYDSRETELHQQVRAQYPQVSLGPGYTYDHGVRKLQFNLSTTLPIFNQNQGPIAEAEARREAAGKHVEAVQATIDSEIAAASAKYDAALRALNAARGGQQAAQKLQRQIELGHAHGEDDRVAVLNAQLAALAAGQAELTALDQAQQALGAVEDAVRAPLEGDEVSVLGDCSALPSSSGKRDGVSGGCSR